MGIFGDFFGGSKKKETTSSVGGGRGSSAYVEKPTERATYYKHNDPKFNKTRHKEGSASSNYIKKRDTAAAARASGDAAAIAAVQPEVIRGAAPEGIKNLMGFTNPVGIMGKIAGWVNDLDPATQKHSVIGGRQLYKNKETDFTYSYNFLGLPYEVKVRPDGSVVDALKIDASGKVPGDMGYNKETNGYALQAQKAEANGDNDTARRIRQEEADNSNTGGGSGGGTDRPSAEQIKDMATAAGVIKNIADMEAIIKDPTKFLDDRGMTLADLMPSMDANTEGTNLDASNPAYGLGDDPSYNAANTGDAATVDSAEKPDVATYDAATSTLTDNELAVGVTGEVSENATVNADELTIDTTGAATGINEDGTTSVLGNALNDFASQDISKVIDTSTVAGKLLAQKLGEGNYTDSKATVLGQMKLISAEFKSSTGEPIIPAWAQSMHRDASKSIAFSGISGTAATAAFSNAIMEATLGVAEKDATFFQTLTTKNLDNRQQAIINKANVLSKLEMANMDVRSQAAVLNAKNFMEMDMQNLSNEQQAEIVNKQAFVQALFDNTKAINAQRLFTADNTNDINKFYSELNSAIQRHNTSETNALSKFNVGEINDASQFNADIKNDRQKFLSNMQYNIDVANAKWRQTVETTNNAIMVEAHTTDVKNALDLTQEAQNNLWDSADNLLDYIWKTTDNDTERELRLLIAQMQAQSGQKSGGGFLDGLFKLGGAYLGSSSGSSWLTGVMTG
jgi:hypothetical protein